MADPTPAPEKDAASPPPEPPVLSGKHKVDMWLKQNYREYNLVRGGNANVRVQDLLNITSLDAERCYIPGEPLTMALDLLTRQHNRAEDVLVLADFTTQLLHALGDRKSTFEQTMDVLEGVPYEILDESTRWIIAPCSDGNFNVTEETVKGGSVGTHWGLLIVDKVQRVAHWVDSAVTLEQIGRKFKITHMFQAGTVAGKVLAGIDEVLATQEGFERGQFDASTLKYVPHQKSGNKTGNDYGPCGPFIFAFLKHLYNHPEKMERLKASFPRRKMGQLKFSSADTRTEISKLIREGSEPQGSLPFKLTFDLLHTLNVIPGDHLRQVVDIFQDPKKDYFRGSRAKSGDDGKGGDEDDDDAGDGDGGGDDDGLDGEYKGWPIRILHAGVEETPEDYSHLDGFEAKYDAYIKRLEDAPGGSDISDPHSRGWEVQYPKGYNKDNLPDFAIVEGEDLKPWMDVSRKLFELNPGIRFTDETFSSVLHRIYKGDFLSLGPSPLAQLTEDRNAFPSGAARMDAAAIAKRLNSTYHKLELPYSFAALSNAEVDRWVERLHPDAYKLVKGPERKGMPRETLYLRARGLLHRMFVGELDDMTAEQVKDWRENDPYIVSEYKQDNEDAMFIMRLLYERNGLDHVPWLLNSPLHWPAREHRMKRGEKRKLDDNDFDGDHDDGKINNKDKRAKTTDGPVSDTPPSGKVPGPTATDTPAPDGGPMEGVAPTEGSGPLDWLHMPESELFRHVTAADRNDPRIGPQANDYSYRALLLVDRGAGSFKDGSQKGIENIWMRDSNVFSHGLAAEGGTFDLTIQSNGEVTVREKEPGTILRRMVLQYEPDHLPEMKKPTLKNKEKFAGPDGSAPGTKGKPPGAKPTTNKTSAKEAASIPAGDVEAIEAKGLYEYTPNMLGAPEDYLQSWVDKHPDVDLKKRRVKTTGLWLVRRVLQKHFGGFDDLPDKTLREWWNKCTYFTEMRTNQKKEFDRQTVIDELNKPVETYESKSKKGKHEKEYYQERNLLGEKEFYSHKYIAWYNANHGTKTTQPAATEPTKETTPDSRTTRSHSKKDTTPAPDKATPSPEDVVSPVKGTASGTKNKSSSPKEKTTTPPKEKTPAPAAPEAPAPTTLGTRPPPTGDDDEWESTDESMNDRPKKKLKTRK